MIGELLDHYRVLELIGRGAMGVVYKAIDVNLDRPVAVKVMSAESRGDPDFVERFRQEARLQAALHHPNVALLFDYFVHDGAPVAVMEFIDGESLEQLIRRRGAIPAHEAIPMFKQALRGVAAAHRAGIIHRDLKPSNLMVTRDDVVKVMDFGIAKRQGVTGATKASTSIGSPLYMAPEQILGRAVDCRTDVYALGITLYELLSGYRPFNARGKSEYLVLNAHVNDLPEPPTVYRFGIPQPVVDAVMRSLAKEPEARFQNAEDFMNALPDVPAPSASVPRADPTGTVAHAHPQPMNAEMDVAHARTGTLVLEYSPEMTPAMGASRSPDATVAIEYSPAPCGDIDGAIAFDYSAATPLQEDPHRSAPSALAARPSESPLSPLPPRLRRAEESDGLLPALRQLLRDHRLGLVAGVIATLALASMIRHAERGQETLGHDSVAADDAAFTAPEQSTATQATTSTEAAVDLAPSSPGAAAEASTQSPLPPSETTAGMSPRATDTPVAAAAPVGMDLSGTWRGEYVDASGRQRLRVTSLRISRVQQDGGIEGTLQYAAASGAGECKLHPRGSSYAVDAQRLQLSPEACTPHYPKELAVPLDFRGVDPRADTLDEGRIEAPSGEIIRVNLRRMSGAAATGDSPPRNAAGTTAETPPGLKVRVAGVRSRPAPTS
jgi:serine/threonine protein kinase